MLLDVVITQLMRVDAPSATIVKLTHPPLAIVVVPDWVPATQLELAVMAPVSSAFERLSATLHVEVPELLDHAFMPVIE